MRTDGRAVLSCLAALAAACSAKSSLTANGGASGTANGAVPGGGAGGGGGVGGTAGTGGAGGTGGTGGTVGTLCRPAAPCPAGWWEYSGSSCDHWGSCWSYGDHLCYQRCTTDTDCTNPDFPICSKALRVYQSDQYYDTYACGSSQPIAACSVPVTSHGGSSGGSAGGYPAGGGVSSGGGGYYGGGGSSGAGGGAGGTGGFLAGGGGGATGGSSTGGSVGCNSCMGGSAGGAGGTTGTIPLVQPIVRPNGNYVLEFGDIFFEVDPKVGARVVTLKYAGGPNLLTTIADDADNYGSTFRLAPQSSWNSTGWPPPPELDIQPYTMEDVASYIWGTSPTAASLSAAVRKLFYPRLNGTIIAEYGIKATANDKSYAPWEVTRVGPGGLTFYPTGDQAPTSGSFALPELATGAGCTWFKYPAQVSVAQRVLADRKEGWLAHVTADGTVLIKTSPDIETSAQAPGEAEVSIYVDGGGKFIELETYGAYRTMPNGLWLSWTSFWHVRKLPSTITATVGNQDLVDWVRGVIQDALVGV